MANEKALPEVTSECKAPKMKPPRSATMEVPRTINVRINDGIMESVDGRGGEAWTLFKHLHESMNDRNSIAVLKQLAAVHGISVEVEE